ncbi:molybdenum cofactor biosynthesis protein MoaB [Candidatus Bathyarchaeota archaeon]|nr:molybdenum cofactor biosynthesis protein MoaB [Candidatus Bathyarchaeota archaeon]
MSESTRQHKAKAPKTLKFGLFICSSSRYHQMKKGERVEDPSGDLMQRLLEEAGHRLVFRRLIPDDEAVIRESVKQALKADVDVIVFCGGTGIAPSDVTIETVSIFLEKQLPGFGEIFRLLSYNEIGSAAIMSRAIAGVARGKVIFCIPGSLNAVKLCFEKLILKEAPHIVKHARE